MEFIKPTTDELKEFEPSQSTSDGITPYRMTSIINEFLREESLPEVTSQRIYTQFVKKVPQQHRKGARLTEEGAKILIRIVMGHQFAKHGKVTKKTQK